MMPLVTTESGRRWVSERLIGILIAACVGYVASLVLDREPPLDLYDGLIEPAKVQRGENAAVIWQARAGHRDCGGLTQRELVDGQRNLWPKLSRERKGIFHPNPGSEREGTVTTPPLEIPEGMSPGPAFYRVTNIYYCNWLQRLLRWPIVKVSPDIHFEVLP